MVPRLISPEYVEQNRTLHEASEVYGRTSSRYLQNVAKVCNMAGTKDVLDYGCGKGGLVQALIQHGFSAKGYDPAIDEYSAYPEPADVVVCTDVLEHIEPEYLEGVLDELARLAKQAAFMVVSTRPAKKILSDGRNAHLIQKSANEWLLDLIPRFKITGFRDAGGGFIVMLRK